MLLVEESPLLKPILKILMENVGNVNGRRLVIGQEELECSREVGYVN